MRVVALIVLNQRQSGGCLSFEREIGWRVRRQPLLLLILRSVAIYISPICNSFLPAPPVCEKPVEIQLQWY